MNTRTKVGTKQCYQLYNAMHIVGTIMVPAGRFSGKGEGNVLGMYCGTPSTYQMALERCDSHSSRPSSEATHPEEGVGRWTGALVGVPGHSVENAGVRCQESRCDTLTSCSVPALSQAQTSPPRQLGPPGFSWTHADMKNVSRKNL